MRTTIEEERSRISRESFGASNWLVGCSIAAAIFLVILVVAGFAIYGVAKKGFGEAKMQVVEEFDRNYTKWNDEKKIPEAHAAVFSDLHDVSQREDA